MESSTVTGAAVEIGPDLYLVRGHHPTSMWSDSNVPNILVWRAGRELYLLDSGLGPAQRGAIQDVCATLAGGCDRVTLLNSHAHLDHMGNNDVLAQIPIAERQHYISSLSGPYLDTLNFFRNAYNEGAGYFDYLAGLRWDMAELLPLLVRCGLSPDADQDRLRAAAVALADAGLTPVISHFMGDLLIRMISETYPAAHPDVTGAQTYESLPQQTFRYGAAEWTGWRVGDVEVFRAHGHTADGVLFYLPERQFLFLADETTTIPIWRDTDPDAAARNLAGVLAMVDAGAVQAVAAGHFPLEVVSGADDIRTLVRGYLAQKAAFESAVDAALVAFPDGVTIDELYDHLAATGGGAVTAMMGMQFPRMPTFFKLTLLNHCRRHCVEIADAAGRPRFRAAR
ncbi:MBL fold metallo-hydrolase [Nakamurella endophytica]|uniref:Metallo-beta-lactamase domain-containing protein n=1 Tax=Nakamurella endophytica TaxID=1748367 RepID=A0A917SRL5_9ACTN|nr:MBL fold metallo-hydrolase [Nakamurella endophytica]GGL94095.1 hypothetical protein GCM10011594_12460 [Nakamurella endophytica]